MRFSVTHPDPQRARHIDLSAARLVTKLGRVTKADIEAFVEGLRDEHDVEAATSVFHRQGPRLWSLYATALRKAGKEPAAWSRTNPGDVVDFESRRKKREDEKRQRSRARVEGILESAYATMIEDPGFQQATRRGRAERTMAEHRAGPQVFQKGDAVAYVGEDEAVPANWRGTVVEHELHSEDVQTGTPGETEQVFEHSYIVKWYNPKLGQYHEGLYAQSDLKPFSRKNPSTDRQIRIAPKEVRVLNTYLLAPCADGDVRDDGIAATAKQMFESYDASRGTLSCAADCGEWLAALEYVKECAIHAEDFDAAEEAEELRRRVSGRRKNPSASRPLTMSEVQDVVKALEVPKSLRREFMRGLEIEWAEHGGGVDALACGRLVLDHLEEDARYYRDR